MKDWNIRNGQRATVKKPGTKEYGKDFYNKDKQFFEKRTKPACSKCGSVNIKAVGKNGQIYVYCANCGKLVRVINTKNTKVGSWTKEIIYRWREGLCTKCGNGHYTGKMHVSLDNKHYVLTLRCNKCGSPMIWHDV